MNMPDLPGLCCGKCQVPLANAQRTYLGVVYCGSCYHKHFIPSTCTRCGRSGRILKDEAPHECPTCLRQARWKGKPCSRCKRPIHTFGIGLEDGRLFCMSCKPYALPPQLCPGCNEFKQDLGRDLRRGVTEPVCGPCRHRLGNAECCAGCRRPRFIAGERDGKRYCANCLPTGAPPIVVCTDCGKHKFHFGSGRCEDCAWRRIHSRLLIRLYAQVPAAWARDLMTEYYQTLRDQIANGTLSKSLRHDVTFFAALSPHFVSAEALSGVLVVRKLGHEFLARYGRVMSFLNVTGYITTYQDPDYELEWQLSRIRSYTARGPTWSHAALDRFLSHMLHKRDLALDRSKRRTVPVKPKSMESAVRAAVAFLTFAAAEGATSLPEVSQDHLELFLGRHRNYRLRIRAFVRYLRRHERRFQKLSVPASKSEFSLKHALSDETRLDLIDQLAQASATVDVRWSLVSLFALVYAQPPHKSVALPLEAVRLGAEGVYEMHFAETWLPLDEVTNSLMARWLSLRRENSCFERDGESLFLFPGRQAGSHIRSDTYGPWLRGKRMTTRALVTTSLVQWAIADPGSPRILMDALGVSRVTATTYCQRLGMQLRPHTRHAFDARA
jgi:hypothetical protein